MATYKHGVYTSEQATSMTAPVTGTAGLQVVVGTAPVNISNIGTVGLATMGAVATAAAVGIADCTKEAQALESAMAPVVRYVDGLADASGAVSDAIADNGKTFKQNYGALKTYILMAANPQQIDTFLFEAGVVLATPVLEEERDGLLPPWKYEASYE